MKFVVVFIIAIVIVATVDARHGMDCYSDRQCFNGCQRRCDSRIMPLGVCEDSECQCLISKDSGVIVNCAEDYDCDEFCEKYCWGESFGRCTKNTCRCFVGDGIDNS